MVAEQKNRIRNWNSRSVGKKWQHLFFYTIIRLTGRRLAYGFMYFIVLWYVLFDRSLNPKCNPYLSRRFPQKRHAWERMLLKYRWITSLAASLIDRAAYGILGSETLRIEVPQCDRLVELYKEGKGLIILSAHTGCWQIAFSALQFMNAEVSIVMHRSRGDIDRQYYEHKDGTAPFQVIDPGDYLGGTIQMAAVLQEGNILGLMGDRLFENENNPISVEFLGGQVKIPASAYRLAAMRGSPIVVLLSHKINYATYRVSNYGVIRVPEKIDRNNEAYRPYARQFMKSVSDFVQEHPLDFYNFFSMWDEQSRKEGVDRQKQQ